MDKFIILLIVLVALLVLLVLFDDVEGFVVMSFPQPLDTRDDVYSYSNYPLLTPIVFR